MENNTPNQMSQIKVPATYMRGGTSKGVFFNLEDLPSEAQVAGEARDKLLLRVIGSQILTLNKSMAWEVRRQVQVKQ